MGKKLTSLTIKNAKPKRLRTGALARNEIPDGGCEGLYLIVQPSGEKSFALRYRFNGKPAKLTLGKAASAEGMPGLTLAPARVAAMAAKHEIERGINPAAVKRAAKAKTRALPSPSGEDSVEKQAAEFLDRHVRRKLRKQTIDQYESVLRRLVLPKWRGRSVHDIRKRDVIDLVEDIAQDRPIMANRTLGVVSKLFNWLAARDVILASPTKGVEMPGVETARDRVLDDGEIAALVPACKDEGVQGAALCVMLGTGCRRGEVAGMKWDEIDDAEQRLWTIPKERVKGKVAHKVWLSAFVWQIIDALPRRGPFVFSVDGTGPVKNFIRVKDRLDAKINFALPWTLHDLRRSAASGLQRLGVRVEVIEAALNHASGSRAGIVGRYQRHDYSDERRDALQRWSDHIEQLLSGKGGKVVRLRS